MTLSHSPVRQFHHFLDSKQKNNGLYVLPTCAVDLCVVSTFYVDILSTILDSFKDDIICFRAPFITIKRARVGTREIGCKTSKRAGA